MLPAVRRCGPPAAAAAAAPLLGISLTVSSLAPPSSMQESDRIILAGWPSGGEQTAHTCNGTASIHGSRGGVALLLQLLPFGKQPPKGQSAGYCAVPWWVVDEMSGRGGMRHVPRY